MSLSFLQGRKTSANAKVAATATSNPLDIAKLKIIKAIESQKAMADVVINGGTIPKKQGGRVTIWFFREPDGKYWTALRYGQSVIPLDENNSYVEVGDASDLIPFYDSVIASIQSGEMDAVINRLRAKRVAALARGRGLPEVPEVVEEPSPSPTTTGRSGRGSKSRVAAE